MQESQTWYSVYSMLWHYTADVYVALKSDHLLDQMKGKSNKAIVSIIGFIKSKQEASH